MNKDTQNQTKVILAVAIVMLLVIVTICWINLEQEKQASEVLQEQAYKLSVLITLQEDILFLKYGYTPDEIGLESYRDAWIDNACYETANAYKEALDRVLDSLEEETNETTGSYIQSRV